MGNQRTTEEVGAIVRRRRESLGLRQEEIPGVSSSTVRLIEKGAPRGAPRGLTMAALGQGLGWPTDAYERLLRGDDPDALDAPARPIEVDASSVDLDELRRADPDAYELLMTMARAALDRANERRTR